MELNINICTVWLQPVWRAVCTNKGPKKLPPIPIAMTSFSGFPVAPTYQYLSITRQPKHNVSKKKKKGITKKLRYITQEPLRTLSENSLILSRTFQTSGTTFFPSLWITASLGARRATWSTDLFSVLFIWRQYPENKQENHNIKRK